MQEEAKRLKKRGREKCEEKVKTMQNIKREIISKGDI